jgi:hypothetical protein
MELVVEPDLYSPNIDENGNYVDKIPSFHIIKKGIMCPCACRKDKVYDSTSVFSAHIKTKAHQKWLVNLNLNKYNYYIETENLKKTVDNQRLIIARLEKELQNKNITIDYFTQQLVAKHRANIEKTDVTNLIDFD